MEHDCTRKITKYYGKIIIYHEKGKIIFKTNRGIKVLEITNLPTPMPVSKSFSIDYRQGATLIDNEWEEEKD